MARDIHMIGKFITGALVLSMAVTLAACGGGGDTETPATPADQATPTTAPGETTTPPAAPTTTP